MRKCVLSLACFGVMCIAVWCVRSRGASNASVTLENAHRIQWGMTLEEVQAIFGEPGEQVHGSGAVFKFIQEWKAEGLTIQVIFGYGSRFDQVGHGESGAGIINYDDGHSCLQWETIDLPLGEPPSQFARFRHWLNRLGS